MEISIDLLMVISFHILLRCSKKRTPRTQGRNCTHTSQRGSSERSFCSLLIRPQLVLDCAAGIKWSDSQRDCQV